MRDSRATSGGELPPPGDRRTLWYLGDQRIEVLSEVGPESSRKLVYPPVWEQGVEGEQEV